MTKVEAEKVIRTICEAYQGSYAQHKQIQEALAIAFQVKQVEKSK